ncbi:ABC transporter ATP-binding protein/permease [Microvirga arabica]|uniref:ABC transporter ATP-binding protein/permease n=1 Tax=Microvirga arabica TaxID=1128671 RepID=A0ABV6YAK4_9HYPH
MHSHTEPPVSAWQPVIAGFIGIAGGWWRGSTTRKAWWLTGALALCLVGNIGVNLALNGWNRAFFDALERRDAGTLGLLVPVFGLLVIAIAGIGVLIVLARETLQVRWRAWLVGRLMDRWLEHKRFYRLSLSGREPSNPEYRIADDSRMATEPVVDFVIGLTHAVLTAIAFIGVLWSVGGSLSLTVAGQSITIPAYLMVAALLYGAAASALTLWVGHPLIGAIARRNEAEARLRFELTRLRENGESVAMIGGETAERNGLEGTYAAVVARWLRVVGLHARLTWITNASGALVPVIPLFLAMPKYLSGELSLGGVTQLAAAFTQVQVAIAWLVDNYKQIAQWHASAERVLALSHTLVDSPSRDGEPTGLDYSRRGKRVVLDRVSVTDPQERVVIRNVDLTVNPGDRVLIMGPSGSGKSTLLRTMAGLWPWGSGRVIFPPAACIGYVPQDPYMPLGSLRETLLYPGASHGPDLNRIAVALHECGLAQLISHLDQCQRWDQVLSRGEQQRLAFARILLQRPELVILDEATSGLDEISQECLMLTLIRELPETTVISVGHRASLRAFHTRCLSLVRSKEGAHLVEEGNRTIADTRTISTLRA